MFHVSYVAFRKKIRHQYMWQLQQWSTHTQERWAQHPNSCTICVYLCMCVYLTACIMCWSSDDLIFDCPHWLCVKLSADQNHRLDIHTDASLEGNQSLTHLQTCFDPHATDGYLSSLPSMFLLFYLSFSLAINISELPNLPFTSLYIFDHYGWKSKGRRPFGLEFCINESFIED